MNIGFTGTQVGMSESQKDKLAEILFRAADDHPGESLEFHHGDCVGADAQADSIARSAGFRVVVHPPTNDAKRAFRARPGDAVREPRPYLVRNVDIVDETGFLVAAPKSAEEELRSGTWATVRYARSIRRLTVILER